MRRRSGLALILGAAVLAGLQSSSRPQPPQGFIATFNWTNPDFAFGGLSGVEISSDGLTVLCLSDQGKLVEARLTRDEAGQIVRAEAGEMRSLHDDKGAALKPRRADSEGMDLAADGTLYVSFEGKPARVMRFVSLDGPAQVLPIDDGFKTLRRNAALEAVAVDTSGVVHAIPEWSAGPEAAFTVYRLIGDTWDHSFSIPRRGNFLPVAADFGPDGRLYVLERVFSGLRGFASRLRRFEVGADGLSAEMTLFETQPGVHDNLEGLSVWRDAAGHLRATMVSDDNFLIVLKTELVEYQLPG